MCLAVASQSNIYLNVAFVECGDSSHEEEGGDGEDAEPERPDLGQVERSRSGRLRGIIGMVTEELLVSDDQPDGDSQPEEQKQREE